MSKKSILIVDDEPVFIRHLRRLLGEDYQVQGVLCAREGLELLESSPPDLILVDLKMPKMGGLEFLQELRRRELLFPTIVMSAYGDVAAVVQAMKLGAVDFVTKPFHDEKLKEDIRLFFSLSERRQEQLFRRKIIGKSRQIQEVWKLIEKFAPSDIPLLLVGESGTGKELFARSIHEMSKKGAGTFVPVDCATIPESLVESELFGYEKGAFTGATARKAGWFEAAHKGTLFLDEVGNLFSSVQAKLLRTLQEMTISPVGSAKHLPIDVRVISATNINLERAVSEGGFRSDLYYRVSAVQIVIPPLRKREGDIPLLVQHFVDTYSDRYGREVKGVSDRAMAILCSHSWPGNVRELENVVKSAVLMAREQITEQEVLPYFHRGIEQPGGAVAAGQNEVSFMYGMHSGPGGKVDLKKIREEAAAEAERRVIRSLSTNSSLGRSELAKQLGVDRKTLRNKLRKLGISLK
jgi:DNA-binding NtrC family response regulator